MIIGPIIINILIYLFEFFFYYSVNIKWTYYRFKLTAIFLILLQLIFYALILKECLQCKDFVSIGTITSVLGLQSIIEYNKIDNKTALISLAE